jgi:proline-specific peptidase
MEHHAVREGTVPFRGHDVWYRIVGGEERGMQLPLVCLAGGPGAPWDYLSPLEALASGRRVVFYDQLGCGNSDVPDDPGLWTVDLFVEEHGDMMRALDLEHYHLLGQSWGGMLAMEYALEDNGDVASLVLASSPSSIPQWESETGKLRALLPEDVQEALLRNEEAGTTDSAEYEQAMMVFYRRHVCRLDPWPDVLEETFSRLNLQIYNTMFGPSEFCVTGTLKDWDIADRLCEIGVPTLITTGRYDEATFAVGKSLNEGIAGSRWVLFEQSSHSAHLEEQQKYTQVIDRFLAEVEAGLR